MAQKGTENEYSVAGCFGEKDLEFALHPLDRQRAAKLLVRLLENNIDWAGAKASLDTFLREQGVTEKHRKEQMVRVEKLMKPWLA